MKILLENRTDNYTDWSGVFIIVIDRDITEIKLEENYVYRKGNGSFSAS